MKKLIISFICFIFIVPLFSMLFFFLALSKNSQTLSSGETVVVTNGEFVLPFKEGQKYSISRGLSDNHNGIDYVAEYGTPVIAISDGIIYRSSFNCPRNNGFLGNWCPFDGVMNGGGNYVILKFTYEDKDYYVQYAHLSELNVKTGDKVLQGEVLGEQGHSGNSTGSHLHFEIHIGGIHAGSKKGLIDPNELFQIEKDDKK